MKSAFVLVCLSLVFGLAKAAEPEPKNAPASKAELKLIDQFSDRLLELIQKKDVKGYVALFGLATDRPKNLETGKAVDLPINPHSEAREALPKKFLTVVGELEKSLGKLNGVTADSVEYFIRRDPHDKEFGVFVFDITLVLVGNGKTLRVWQPTCTLGMRGVLIGDGLMLRTSTDL